MTSGSDSAMQTAAGTEAWARSETSVGTGMLRAAREFLMTHRTDYDTAVREFSWPRPATFNFGLDWFDVIATEHPDRPALAIVEENGDSGSWTYAKLSARSDQVAVWLREVGVRRGDRIILMLGNQVELWEVILAVIKLGAVLIPASTLLSTPDLRDRVDRGNAGFVIARDADAAKFVGVAGGFTRIAVGMPVDGWISYVDSASASDHFE